MFINQTQAHNKLVEMWKAKNNHNYPIKLENSVYPENTATTRGVTAEQFKVKNTPNTFIGDTTRTNAPQGVKNAKSVQIAKKEAKNL